jgi:hypothetical protein
MTRPLRTISIAALAVVVADVLIGVAMLIAGTPQGLEGSYLFPLMYGGPLLLIALAVRSDRAGIRITAGIVALLLAVFYTAIVIGNWRFYTQGEALLAILLTAPTVAADLAIFWGAAIHRPRIHAATS